MNFETEQNAPELMLSPLQKERLEYRPTVPSELDNLNSLAFEEEGPASCIASLATAFPHLTQQKLCGSKGHKSKAFCSQRIDHGDQDRIPLCLLSGAV